MKSIAFRAWTFPLALLILCILSFGTLAPWLGFYWDDWPSIWYLHLLGPAGFRDVFAIDRPLLGRLFMLTTAVIGESALGWQIFGLVTRWACCLALWWTLRTLWPENPRETAWTALLFAAYPGFTQQSIAVTYSHGWIILSAFFLSLGIMIQAVRRPAWRWPLLAASGLLSLFTLFTSEYFFGLELLRPPLLWLALSQEGASRRESLQRAGLYWAPYIGVLAVFLFWRIFLHETPRGHIQVFGYLSRDPIGTVVDIARTVIQDGVQSSLLAWGQALNFARMASFGRGPTLLYLAIVLVTAPLAIFYLAKFRPFEKTTTNQENNENQDEEIRFIQSSLLSSEETTTNREINEERSRPLRFIQSSLLSPSESQQPSQAAWAKQAILIGGLALLVGGIPFWVTYLPIELRFPWDRFTLAMMLGASLLLGGLLALLPVRLLLKAAVLGALVGLAAGFHVQQANLYRREWNVQKLFFWQLSWRAPGIEPGTAILTAELPFTVFSDNSLTAPLNWIYAPENSSRQMPYLLYAVESRLKTGLPRLEKDRPIEQPYRATSFSGSTSRAIAIFSEPPGCVKVVDPVVDARLPQKPNYIDELLPLSNPSLIQAEPEAPARPPQAIFGEEPEHGWCYYFEKADLARQQGDWQQVVELGEIALQLDVRLYEVNAPELVPYIEGYARTGDWEKARQLTLEAHRLQFRMKRMLCDAWDRLERDTAPDERRQAALTAVRGRLQCAKP